MEMISSSSCWGLAEIFIQKELSLEQIRACHWDFAANKLSMSRSKTSNNVASDARCILAC